MNNVMPINGAKKQYDTEDAKAFINKIQCITSVKLICQLTQAVQQHRGATLGYLSGEDAFLSIAERQSQMIDKLFASYLLHNGFSADLPGPVEVSNSLDSWQVIKFDWQSDELLHNFEFHSHLVDNLKKIIRGHMRDTLMPDRHTMAPGYELLLETVFITLPNTIEELAKLRGLSTNAAVVQACGSDSHTRLSFLLKDIPRLLLALEQALENIIEDYPEFDVIRPGRGQQRRLNALLKKINTNILNSRKIQEDSTQLFRAATDIIDAFWLSMEMAIQRMEQLQYRSFIA